VAAVAATLVIAVGLDELRLRRELALLREVTATLHAPNVTVAFDLRGTDHASRAFGSAILDLDAKKAALVVRGLPELPSGQHYLLWAQVGEEMVPCGRFASDDEQNVVRQLAIPVQEYSEPVSRLVVTVETDPTVSAPTGPRVMLSS
jgi:hypothetical protein